MLRLRREKGKGGGFMGRVDCRVSLAVRILNQKREHDYANRDQHYSEASTVAVPAFLAEEPENAKHEEE
jgi:hypothetical protein